MKCTSAKRFSSVAYVRTYPSFCRLTWPGLVGAGGEFPASQTDEKEEEEEEPSTRVAAAAAAAKYVKTSKRSSKCCRWVLLLLLLFTCRLSMACCYCLLPFLYQNSQLIRANPPNSSLVTVSTHTRRRETENQGNFALGKQRTASPRC